MSTVQIVLFSLGTRFPRVQPFAFLMQEIQGLYHYHSQKYVLNFLSVL